MNDDQRRQAGKPRKSRITDAMLKEGEFALTASCGEEPSASVVAGIYEAMEAARIQGLRSKPSRQRRKR